MKDFFIPMVYFLLAFLIGAFMGLIAADKRGSKMFVEHGCAEYNSTTGDFQWKDGKP